MGTVGSQFPNNNVRHGLSVQRAAIGILVSGYRKSTNVLDTIIESADHGQAQTCMPQNVARCGRVEPRSTGAKTEEAKIDREKPVVDTVSGS